MGEKCLAKSARSLSGGLSPEIDVEIFGIEFDAHQEEAGFFVGVFVGVQNVAAVAVDEVGDGGDFAFGVRAGDEEDGGVFHSLEEGDQRPFLRSFSAIRAFTSFFRREPAEACPVRSGWCLSTFGSS